MLFRSGKQWYWNGPEIGENFLSNRVYDAGTYYIRVFNESNTGQYIIPYLFGSTLDFVEDLSGAKFVIENPNAKTTCGCGESFTV